ncbi:hypothetical protein K2P97_04850 [bacterium]|nr:hypothetical protein [bacterium]
MLSLLSLKAVANNEWFEFYNNTRSLGMGGASVAVTSDDTSLYRNPANLGSIRDIYGTALDPEIEGTSNLTAAQIDIKSVMETLSTKPDTYYRSKQQISPVLVRRNVGFGFIYKNEISAEISSADLTVMDTKYINDAGAVFGANLRLFDGRIKIGAAAKFINRIEVQNSALSTSGPTDLQTIGSEGSAVAFDGGLLIQAPWTYIPTLGVVVRDIGDTAFDKKDGFRMRTTTRPATVKQSVDAAIALFPIHSNQFRSVWTIEYSDITNSRNDTDSAKRAHLGIEFNTRDIFFVRLGYNQRYATAGLEIASENIVWQLATYGEEIGTQAAPREDRRISTKLAIRF